MNKEEFVFRVILAFGFIGAITTIIGIVVFLKFMIETFLKGLGAP